MALTLPMAAQRRNSAFNPKHRFTTEITKVTPENQHHRELAGVSHNSLESELLRTGKGEATFEMFIVRNNYIDSSRTIICGTATRPEVRARRYQGVRQ